MHHDIVEELVSNAQRWTEIDRILVLVEAAASQDQRSGQRSPVYRGQLRVNRGWVEIGPVAVLFLEARIVGPAYARVQRQFGGDLVAILRKQVEILLPTVEIVANRLACIVDEAQLISRKAKPVVGIAGTGGLQVRKIEGIRARARTVIDVMGDKITTKAQVVTPFAPGERVAGGAD